MYKTIYHLVPMTSAAKFAYWNENPTILPNGCISITSINKECTIELQSNYITFTAKFANYEGKQPYWAEDDQSINEKNKTQTLKLFYEHTMIAQQFSITNYPSCFAYPLFLVWGLIHENTKISPQHFDSIPCKKITTVEVRTDLPCLLSLNNSIWNSKLISPADDLYGMPSSPVYAEYNGGLVSTINENEAIIFSGQYYYISTNNGSFIKKYNKNDGSDEIDMSMAQGFYGDSKLKILIEKSLEFRSYVESYLKKSVVNDKVILRDVKLKFEETNENGHFELYSNGLSRCKFTDGCIVKYTTGSNIANIINCDKEVAIHLDYPLDYEYYIVALTEFLNRCKEPYELQKEKDQQIYEDSMIEWELKKLEVANILYGGKSNSENVYDAQEAPYEQNNMPNVNNNMGVDEVLAKSNETLEMITEILLKNNVN